MSPSDKERFLAQFKDPAVREHYRAELELAEEVEGMPLGGIFDSPHSENVVRTGFNKELPLPPREKKPSDTLKIFIRVTIVMCAVAVGAILRGCFG